MNQTGIAEKMGVHKGTMLREFRQNKGKRGWRPKQAQTLRDKHRQVSHEIIYPPIYANKRNGGDLHPHLRSQKSHRKRYASGQKRRGMIKNRVSIDERPEIGDCCRKVTHWEGDTVIGKNHKGGLFGYTG